jgi:hypothetical protein
MCQMQIPLSNFVYIKYTVYQPVIATNIMVQEVKEIGLGRT